MRNTAKLHLLFLLFFVPALVFSGLENNSAYNLLLGLKERQFFNPENIITIKGTISAVLKVKNPDGKTYGVHLKVKSENEDFSIHLGPEWFLEELGLKLKEGERSCCRISWHKSDSCDRSPCRWSKQAVTRC
jgi:hypothetical protein